MSNPIRESELRAVLDALNSARFWLALAIDDREQNHWRLQIRRLEAERERLTPKFRKGKH